MEPSRRVAGRERRGQAAEEMAAREAAEEMAVHSRVRKIKRESDKVVDWWPDPLETRPHLREIAPSPLGLPGAAIAVDDS